MKVVGVNSYTETEPSPLTADLDAAIQTADPEAERAAIADIEQWRAERDQSAVDEALDRLRAEAKTDTNLMAATLDAVRAGATVGEWAGALREVFGEYRAPTGVTRCRRRRRGRQGARPPCASGSPPPARSSAPGCVCSSASRASTGTPTAPSRSPCVPATPGSRSSTRAFGSPPAQIVAAAVAEDVHCVGLSILSGSHMELVPEVQKGLAEEGMGDVPVIVGGIIPDSDARALESQGVAAVFTPKDFGMTDIMGRIVDEIRKANHLS